MKTVRDKSKRKPLEPLYTALADDDFDFSWYLDELDKIRKLWTEGCSLVYIAEAVKRDPDEVLVLMVDLGRKGMIEQRGCGVFG